MRRDGDRGAVVQIRVKGHLDSGWSEWFGGMTITNVEDGEALLTGSMVDQAALQGALKKIRDLGLALISVNPVGASTGNEAPADRGD
jgi:hypothetical protein